MMTRPGAWTQRSDPQETRPENRRGDLPIDPQDTRQRQPPDDPQANRPRDRQENRQNALSDYPRNDPQDTPPGEPQNDPQASLQSHPRENGPDERFVYVSVDDPRAAPLFEELEYEYRTRYAAWVSPEELGEEMKRYPAHAFAPPHGAFLLLLRAGVAVAGGAFMRHADPGTTEFKRIWTRASQRRQGLARRVLAELEAQARRQGYTRVVLGTGPRQPEALALYPSTGYTLLYARDFGEPQPPGALFEKQLAGQRRAP